MLQARNLTLTHRKDLRVILEDFELTLNDGDKAVIIGEEGNGKSTLLKWMYDPERIASYMEAEGLRVIGRERLGYLPQELPETEKKKTVYEYTDISLEGLPENLQKEIQNGKYIETSENLYGFLENYSS